MKREMIMLKTINDVKAFVNSVVKCDFDVDLTSMPSPSWASLAWTFPSLLPWRFIRTIAQTF